MHSIDKRSQRNPVFLGVEHVALYPSNEPSAEEIAQWYSKTFGFSKTEGRSSIMVSGQGLGRIEIVKTQGKEVRCHIAIYVSNFEEACKYLREKGFELEEPKIKKGVKAAYLKDSDPLGNRVNLIYKT